MEPVFQCPGCVDFACVAGLKSFAFRPETDSHWLKWSVDHMKACNPDFKPCNCDAGASDLYEVTDGVYKGKLRCIRCKYVMRRKVIPFFEGTHLKTSQLLAVLYSTCAGLRRQFSHDEFDISTKSITQWQIFFSELAVSANKKLLVKVLPLPKKMQIDETAFGVRK